MLGREKRLEKLRSGGCRDAAAGVRDADRYHLVLAARGGNEQLAMMRLLHRLDGIADQVEQDLLDLHLVGQYEIRRRIELELDADALILDADQRQSGGFLDELAEAFDAAFAL